MRAISKQVKQDLRNQKETNSKKMITNKSGESAVVISTFPAFPSINCRSRNSINGEIPVSILPNKIIHWENH